MNLLKKFVRSDNADLNEEEEYEDIYAIPEDIKMDMSEEAPVAPVSPMDAPIRKEPEIRPVAADKVSLKLMQPKSHTEAAQIADKLKEGCIVLLDIGNLTKEQAHRLVDFLAGVAYVLGGEMIKTNKHTIVVSPAGVDVTGFMPQTAAPAPARPQYNEEYTEENE